MDQTSKAVTTGVIVYRIITVANLALTFALFISGSGGSLTRTVVFMAWLALGVYSPHPHAQRRPLGQHKKAQNFQNTIALWEQNTGDHGTAMRYFTLMLVASSSSSWRSRGPLGALSLTWRPCAAARGLHFDAAGSEWGPRFSFRISVHFKIISLLQCLLANSAAFEKRCLLMSILIQNGILVLPTGPIQADLRVAGGRIAELGPGLAPGASRVIDAQERLVFPGFIDTHTHFEMNKGFPNETADDWYTGTRAALAGGTTTVLDFAEPERGATLASALETWHGRADGAACCNYGFHMTVKDWSLHPQRTAGDDRRWSHLCQRSIWPTTTSAPLRRRRL